LIKEKLSEGDESADQDFDHNHMSSSCKEDDELIYQDSEFGSKKKGILTRMTKRGKRKGRRDGEFKMDEIS
jgi:hypothetical protein